MKLNLREIIEVPGGSIPFACELETDGLDFPAVLRYKGKPHAGRRAAPGGHAASGDDLCL